MAIPSAISFMYLAFAFVFVFGLGYIIVSNDLSKSHEIVKLGALSKILAFSIIFHGCIVKTLPPILFIAAFIDLMCFISCFYFHYCFHIKKYQNFMKKYLFTALLAEVSSIKAYLI